MRRTGKQVWYTIKDQQQLFELLQDREKKMFECPSMTSYRIEQGDNVRKKTAHEYHRALKVMLKREIAFDDLFKKVVVREVYFGWTRVTTGALHIGQRIFDEFRADVVLTFPGPSGIFANLVMTRFLSPEQFLRIPVYTASFANHQPPAEMSAFREIVLKDTFKVLMPKALVEDIPCLDRKKLRIAIIDDSIITGTAMRALREYMQTVGYDKRNLRVACCVCDEDVLKSDNKPDYWDIPTKVQYYSLPWGDAFSFDSCFAPKGENARSVHERP